MANRYWVGGTATWNGTAGSKWASTSNGTPGQNAPTTSDTVFFDFNSGQYTVTIGTGAVCSTLTMTGFPGTLAFGSNSISAAGTGTVYLGATTFDVTGTPLINLTNSSSTGRTINAGATTEANSISFNISAGSGTTTITASTSVKNLTFSGTYTGAHANSAYTIYGNLTFKSGMTITAGVGTRTFAATSGTQQITSATLNLDFPITFSGTATYQLQDNISIGTATSRTITLTSGTLDLNTKTMTLFGTFVSSNTNTRAITSSGTISITRAGTATYWDMGTLTGFTKSGNPTVKFLSSVAGNSVTVLHGTVAGGSEANAMSFVFGGAGTYIFANTNWIFDLSSIGSSYLISGSPISYNVYGALGGAYNFFGAITFKSTSATTRDITFSGYSPYTITFDGVGGSWRLMNYLNFNSVVLTNGSFSTNGSNMDCNFFDFTNSNTKTLTINSQITVGGNGYFRGSSTNTTFNLSGSEIYFNSDAVVQIFNVPNATFPLVTTADIADLIIGQASGTSQTITTLQSNNPKIVAIYPNSTLNITNLNLASGTTLKSVESGTQGTISKPSGTVLVSGLTIQDSNATGGATWLAPTSNGNADFGNNTGWIFGAYSANNSNFLAFF